MQICLNKLKLKALKLEREEAKNDTLQIPEKVTFDESWHTREIGCYRGRLWPVDPFMTSDLFSVSFYREEFAERYFTEPEPEIVVPEITDE